MMNEILISAIRLLAEEVEGKQRLIDKYKKQIAKLEAERKIARLVDAFLGRKSWCTIDELAQAIKRAAKSTGRHIAIEPKQLWAWMKEKGFIVDGDLYPQVKPKCIKQGMFETERLFHGNGNGVTEVKTLIKVTRKGLSYFLNGFLSGKFTI